MGIISPTFSSFLFQIYFASTSIAVNMIPIVIITPATSEISIQTVSCSLVIVYTTIGSIVMTDKKSVTRNAIFIAKRYNLALGITVGSSLSCSVIHLSISHIKGELQFFASETSTFSPVTMLTNFTISTSIITLNSVITQLKTLELISTRDSKGLPPAFMIPYSEWIVNLNQKPPLWRAVLF